MELGEEGEDEAFLAVSTFNQDENCTILYLFVSYVVGFTVEVIDVKSQITLPPLPLLLYHPPFSLAPVKHTHTYTDSACMQLTG